MSLHLHFWHVWYLAFSEVSLAMNPTSSFLNPSLGYSGMAISDLWNSFIGFVTPLASNIVVAVVILLVGVIVAKILERLVHRILHELELDKWLRIGGFEFPLEHTAASTIRYLFYFLAVVIALNQVGLTATVLNLVAAATLVLVIAAILLGLKDFIPNFIAGITIHKRGIKEGDVIRVRNVHGDVQAISLLDTKIKTDSGDILFIPNSLLTKNEVLRYKRKKSKRKKE